MSPGQSGLLQRETLSNLKKKQKNNPQKTNKQEEEAEGNHGDSVSTANV